MEINLIKKKMCVNEIYTCINYKNPFSIKKIIHAAYEIFFSGNEL